MTDTPPPAKAAVPAPRPAADPVTEFFWKGAAEGRLLMLRCNDCGKYLHPPRPICRFCLSSDVSPSQLSGRATLYSWTVAEQPFHPFFADKIPYVYATVEPEEQAGLRLITNIVDCDPRSLRADMPVEVIFREVDEGLVLPLFRPVEP